MKNKIKVLQLHPDFNVKVNDISDLAEQIIKALPKTDFEVTSAYLSKSPKENQAQSIADHSVYFNLPEQSMKGLRIIALWKLYQHLKEQKYDVIICNRFKTISMLLLLQRMVKTPLCIGISHVIGEYDRKYRQLQIKGLSNKNWHFIGVSQAVQNYLIQLQCGFTHENTTAIPNAIDAVKADLSQLERNTARVKLGLPIDAKIIGTIGQLFPRKGHRFLIEALFKIRNQHPNAHIAIIGKGQEESKLKALINELGLADQVHLLGFRENALQFVKAFDIWAMPSLKEGLPLALLEGISGHLPVIASDIPEMHDIVQSVGGLLFKPGDINQLADCLNNYLSLDKDILEQLGHHAFNVLINSHSIERYREQYLNLISQRINQ